MHTEALLHRQVEADGGAIAQGGPCIISVLSFPLVCLRYPVRLFATLTVAKVNWHRRTRTVTAHIQLLGLALATVRLTRSAGKLKWPISRYTTRNLLLRHSSRRRTGCFGRFSRAGPGEVAHRSELSFSHERHTVKVHDWRTLTCKSTDKLSTGARTGLQEDSTCRCIQAGRRTVLKATTTDSLLTTAKHFCSLREVSL